ncbi:MAG: deoxyribodipyrimidine photolyase [Chloroflexi bacterium RBG_13_50_21]|nr:MAG: deoxyribodipyrimidine photolyase [Chloroflexi bacterium RBG_13_50_21]
MNRAIWWIRRDLRLSDNQALAVALVEAEIVIPVFILDPNSLDSQYNSQQRMAFLFEGLRSLESDLRKKGSNLIVRKGNPLEVLHILCAEAEAEGIFAEADVSPYARQRDTRVMRELPLELIPGITLHPADKLLKPDGSPYSVFTPFRRMWYSLPFPGKPLPAPERLAPPPSLANHGVPDFPRYSYADSLPVGEAIAQSRLARFLSSLIKHYAEDRNRMDLDHTSQLSPYLRFGMLSARQAAWAAHVAQAFERDITTRQGADVWLNELIWREFYATILYHFPYVRLTAFRPKLRYIQWFEDTAGFDAWSAGRSGYPVVDAAMRQLNETGWMHNRARMITASFLTKDLLIDWRQGERYFMQHLLDGDPAANNGGWQWIAGTGTDAAPYFRIFNPVLQGKKFDPHGIYVRHWVPELSDVPARFIHNPWEMPTHIQEKVGCVIGKNYPAPMVDHAKARQRALAAYREGAI